MCDGNESPQGLYEIYRPEWPYTSRIALMCTSMKSVAQQVMLLSHTDLR